MSDVLPSVPPASDILPPSANVVLFDSGSIASDRLSRLIAHSSIEIVGGSTTSTTRSSLEKAGQHPTSAELENPSIGDAFRRAAATGAVIVYADVPESAEDWMRSILEAIADIVVAGGSVPLLHVLGRGTLGDGPVAVATTSGRIGSPEVGMAIRVAGILGRDVEIVTPTADAEDDDVSVAQRRAENVGVRLTHRAVADPDTDMIVRAAAVSVVLLAVLDVDGKLRAGKPVKHKTLAGGSVKGVIDAIGSAPPHDLLIYFDGPGMVDGVSSTDDGSDVTDGSQPLS